MKEYFRLQNKRLNRALIDFGIPLVIAYVIVPIIFVFLSNHLFSITVFAGYVYVFVALIFISGISERKRNSFLMSIFDKKKYLKLRVVENLVCCSPFLIFLLYKQVFVLVVVLLILAILMVFFNYSIATNFAMPTPFGKKPFEFAIGFRKTFFVFPFAYFLAIMSIRVDNFNLGVFSMILVTLVCLSYYSKPERKYFVWNFKMSSKKFLQEKIKNGMLFLTILNAPILAALLIFYIFFYSQSLKKLNTVLND